MQVPSGIVTTEQNKIIRLWKFNVHDIECYAVTVRNTNETHSSLLVGGVVESITISSSVNSISGRAGDSGSLERTAQSTAGHCWALDLSFSVKFWRFAYIGLPDKTKRIAISKK